MENSLSLKNSWIVLLIFIVLFSCQEKKKLINQEYYQVEIKDSLILNSVNDYIKENNICKDSSIIIIRITNTYYRQILFIRHDIRSIEQMDLPTYYTIINGSIVLIYTDVCEYIFNNKIKDELNNLIISRKIKLYKKNNLIFEPTYWEISKCDTKITRNIGRSTLANTELPCFLKYEVKDGKANIIEEDWHIKEKNEYYKSKE